MRYTSPRLNALRTVLFALFGREPTHYEMTALHRFIYK